MSFPVDVLEHLEAADLWGSTSPSVESLGESPRTVQIGGIYMSYDVLEQPLLLPPLQFLLLHGGRC